MAGRADLAGDEENIRGRYVDQVIGLNDQVLFEATAEKAADVRGNQFIIRFTLDDGVIALDLLDGSGEIGRDGLLVGFDRLAGADFFKLFNIDLRFPDDVGGRAVIFSQPAGDRDQLEERGTPFNDVYPGRANRPLNEEVATVVLFDGDIDFGVLKVSASKPLSDLVGDSLAGHIDDLHGAEILHRDIAGFIDPVIARKLRGILDDDLDDVTDRKSIILVG